MKRRIHYIPIIFLSFVLWTGEASAQSCTGRFVNPVTDVCWECLFPISIGPIRIGSAAGAPDTPNPAEVPSRESASRSASGNPRG